MQVNFKILKFIIDLIFIHFAVFNKVTALYLQIGCRRVGNFQNGVDKFVGKVSVGHRLADAWFLKVIFDHALVCVSVCPPLGH